MDQIDISLLEAWNRLSEVCRRDRVETLKRYRRTNQVSMRSPPRAWCVAIRASDTRISDFNATFSFEPDQELLPNENTAQAVARGVPHLVTLTGKTIRKLCAPVEIEPPGVPMSQVAPRLGMSVRSAWEWVDRKGGLALSHREEAFKHRGKGSLIPIVNTNGPVDPNSPLGSPPEAMWGSLWLTRHMKIPEDYTMTARRVPRLANVEGRMIQMGWWWECPGRLQVQSLSADDHQVSNAVCGRRTRYLYGPLPIWTLAQALNEAPNLELPQDCGLHGLWQPGRNDPMRDRRSLACKACWNVQCATHTNAKGWNAFVSYLSGGLLYGREVERPLQEAPRVRKRAYRARKNVRGDRLRARLLPLLLGNFSRREIARLMSISMHCVDSHIKWIHRIHGVHSRGELIGKLNGVPGHASGTGPSG